MDCQIIDEVRQVSIFSAMRRKIMVLRKGGKRTKSQASLSIGITIKFVNHKMRAAAIFFPPPPTVFRLFKPNLARLFI